jgi:predicted transcriptional regulator
MKLCTLLFELSNEDRINILFELNKTPMKLSRVAEKFKFTVPETARNISRLCEANLIAKDVEGLFHLTSYGDAALKLLPGFDFLCKHQGYFKTHTLSGIPSEYSSSIGALVDCKFFKEITTAIFKIENMIREAQEFIWIMMDQIHPNGLLLTKEAVNRGVEFRKIMPRNVDIPEEILELTRDPAFEHASRAQKFWPSRYLDKVDVSIFLSEREVGSIAFPKFDGCFDFLGFHGGNESALNWSKSLFLYYWGKSKP